MVGVFMMMVLKRWKKEKKRKEQGIWPRNGK